VHSFSVQNTDMYSSSRQHPHDVSAAQDVNGTCSTAQIDKEPALVGAAVGALVGAAVGDCATKQIQVSGDTPSRM